MNSTFANLPGHQKMETRFEGRLEMHPDDASARGIADGDIIQVFNDRGSLAMEARWDRTQTAACDPAWLRAAWRGTNFHPMGTT